MKRFYLFMFALVCTMVAWADGVATVDGIRNGYIYTIRSARNAITWDGTSANCVGAALDADNPNHQFVAIKVLGSTDRFYFYNVGAGKFLGKSETEASLTEYREVYWKMKASGNETWPFMIDAQDGNHVGYGYDGELTVSSRSQSSFQLTEVGAADEVLLADIAAKPCGIRNGYIYTIRSARNAITWDGTSANCVGATLDADNPNHQFVAVKVAGFTDRFYFYNVGAGKFMGKNGTDASLTDSCEVYWKIKASGNESWPLMLDAQDGNHFNFGGSGQIEINSRSTIDAGNSMQIAEVGVADDSLQTAIAMKVYSIKDGYIYTIRSSRNAITWDGTSANCVGATLDADNPNHQFVVVKVAGFTDRFYFYNVGAGKFMGKNGTDASLTDSCEVYWKIRPSGNTTWPLMIDSKDGNHFNFGGSGQITIDSWDIPDAGNKLQIAEVGTADAALLEAIRNKIAGAPVPGHYYRIKNTAQGLFLGIDGYTLNMKHKEVTAETTGDNNPELIWLCEQDGDNLYMKNVYSGLYPQNIPSGSSATAKIGTGKDYAFTYAVHADPTETEVAQWNIFFGGRQVNCEGAAAYKGYVNYWFGDNAHYYIYEVEAPEDAFASMCADWYKANPYTETAPAKIELAEDAYKVISPSEFGNPVDINNAIDKLSLSADDATQEKVHQLFQNIISEASAVNAYVNAVNSYGALLSVVYETKVAEWATIILPVNWSKPEGWTRYSCAATEGNILTLAEVGDGVNKNTPFIIKVGEAQQGKKYQFIGYSTGAATTNQTAGLLTGVLEDGATVPVGSYILSKYNDKMGFYRVAEGTSYDAAKNKCYLTLPDAAARYAALFFEGDTETGIDGISDTEAKQGNGVIYNMSGQRMNKMQKGLNIVNGKIILK